MLSMMPPGGLLGKAQAVMTYAVATSPPASRRCAQLAGR